MNKQSWMRTGLSLVVGLMLLAGCVAESHLPLVAETGGLFATTKGWVIRINRSELWFELKPKSGAGDIVINFDANTALLNFKDMIEITKEQPLEVSYMPGSEPSNRAISIRKLQPDGCN